MGYASLTDAETYGLIPSAFGLNVTTTQIQSALDARSAWADTRLRGRYSMPVQQPYDPALVRAVVHMARYDLLALRGFDEDNDSDQNVVLTCKAAEDMLDGALRQTVHLAIVESPAPTSAAQPQYAAPLLVSNPQQGWIPTEGVPPIWPTGIQ